MAREFLTTGQAAKLCSVTPDTVLKWIKSGKLPAIRTPGGHHRIVRRHLLALRAEDDRQSVRYCWEYRADGDQPREACLACLVYRSRTLRCYEMAELRDESGCPLRTLTDNCKDCEYYQIVHGQGANVLVFTSDPKVARELHESPRAGAWNLEVAGSVYELSAAIQAFRPDVVVIDADVGQERAVRVAEHLQADDRLQMPRIVLAMEPEDLPERCEEGIFAHFAKPITVARLQVGLRDILEVAP